MDKKEMILKFNITKKERRKEANKDYYLYLLKLKEIIEYNLKNGYLSFHNTGFYGCGIYNPNMFPHEWAGSFHYYRITKLGIYKLNRKIKKLEKKVGELL